MGIPVRAGRAFDGRDTASSPSVAIVSESLSRRAWPGASPLGRPIVVDERPATVVGVVGDVRLVGLDAGAPDTVYVPFAQALFGLFPEWSMDVVVRSSRDPASLAGAVRREVALADPALPVFALRTLDELVASSWARRRAAIALLGAFAAMALLLAAVGVYGVVSQSARQRTREIGVRLALGARPRDISRLVLGEAIALVGAGCAFGLALGWAAGRLLSTLLFGVRPGDPATLAGAAAVLTLVAIAAALLPALRASRVQPLVALRDE
jgi:putative ABC transport system permease protein